MARSKFYGYTLAGYPAYKKWSLSELPINLVSVFTLGTSSTVTSNSEIPITSTVINQTGSNLQGNTVWIPGGFYKISWNSTITTSAAAQVLISLNGTNGTINETSGATSTISTSVVPVTLGRDTFISVPPTGTTLSLINSGSTDITVSGDLQFIITRIL